MAKAPAPYPKLASMQHTGRGGGPIQTVELTKLSGDDFARLESIFGPLAGPGDDHAPNQGGEGEAAAERRRIERDAEKINAKRRTLAGFVRRRWRLWTPERHTSQPAYPRYLRAPCQAPDIKQPASTAGLGANQHHS
ncbi:hypothetical protein NKJ70_16905 [Mesorhizobium sp. M0092]|uniref:hypothetical protein n=1 Tax=unclassified Mesorhizobium TaxID=325217 RepID=UPI0033397232